MYEALEPAPQPFYVKFYRYLYPIISISLLNYTMSNTYSLMTNGDESTGKLKLYTGFISIIVSSLICFFISQSHLTIYGVSILSIVYLNMIKGSFNRSQICQMTFLAGLLIGILWQLIHNFSDIFHYLPGKVHAGMILGIGMIVLAKFFPLTVENISIFYERDASLMSNPLKTIMMTFQEFSFLTLSLTIVSIGVMFFARRKLARFPSILVLAILGILINIKGNFLTYSDLCSWPDVDCTFYLVKLKNLVLPRLEELLYLLPASSVLAAILVLQQFLYLQQFQRRGKRKNQSDLGQVRRQSLVMCLANVSSGLIGGLPVSINLFATYEHFSFSKKYGFRGSKIVGLSQILVNYFLYGILKGIYDKIPLFIIFCIIITPLIYFFKTVYKLNSKDLKLVVMLGLLNVLTHPVIALVAAAFLTIGQMAGLLKSAPAEIVIEIGKAVIQLRESTTFEKIQTTENDQYYAKIISIEDDIPPFKQGQDYVLYRFTGSVSYLNFHLHYEEIMSVISRKGTKKETPFDDLYSFLIFSFRYVQNIDDEAMEDFQQVVKQIKESNRKKKVLITGLHSTLLTKFKGFSYFRRMLEEEDRCFYRLHGKDLL